MRVADGIRAALGDSGQQRLRGQRARSTLDSGLRLYPAMPHITFLNRTPLIGWNG